MFCLFLSIALALTPPDAELQRVARDFAFDLGAADVKAFEPLAVTPDLPAKGEAWHDVRVAVERWECRTVTGVRSTIIESSDSEAVVLVAVNGTSRVRGNGKIVPFRTPWTLRLQHDAAGWRIRSARWTVQELWFAYAAGGKEWEAMRWAEGFVDPAEWVYKLADYASDGHLPPEHGLRVIDYAEIVARENHDEARLAFCDFARARIMWGLKDFARGRELALRAVERARAAGDPEILAAALFGLGLDETRSHPLDALAHYREAAGLMPYLDNPRIAEASLINIASIDFGLHDYRAAIKACEQGLEMVRIVPWPNGEADLLKSLADAHAYLQDYAVARRLAERALELARVESKPLTLDRTLEQLGGLEYALGDVVSGDKHFHELLEAVRRDQTPEGCQGLSTYGEALFARARYVEADQMLREAVDYAHRVHEGSCAAAALATLSELRFQEKRYTEAADLARLALNESFDNDRENPEFSAKWRPRVALGRALAGSGKTAEAIETLRSALDDIESERGDVEVAASSVRFMTGKLDAYHALIDVLLRAKRTREAFDVAERMRGRRLVLAFDRKVTARDYTPEESAREEQLEKHLVEINRGLLAARATGDQARIATLRGELSAARLDLDRFDEETHFIHASAHAHEAMASDPGEQRLPAELRDTALVEYVVMERSTVAFSLHGSRVTARRLPIGRAALTRKVEAFCKRIESRDLGYGDDAKQLYRLLLAPLDLRGASTLAIVPDLELWRLPFHALVAPDGRFVVERSAVFYTPSLAMLRKARGVHGAATKKETLLAFGNPVVNDLAAAKLRDVGYDDVLRPLPDAEREVRSIASLYGTRSRVFVRAAASERTFKQEAAHFDVLHLATHGFLDDESPMYSALLFATAPNQPDEDGLLETREILRLRLHARTAVLAACDTARGATGAGEGVIGISWAFLMAGCPTTVVTQWKAASASAAQLMIDFHRHLQHGETNTSSLRAAQLAMLHDRTRRHPFYWAPFVVVGAP